MTWGVRDQRGVHSSPRDSHPPAGQQAGGMYPTGMLSCFRIDFHIPTVETVGGYSMTSSPNSFRKKQSLDLAVKFSTHPPAHWLHLKVCVNAVSLG